jgi:hypothetical protein
LYDAHIASFKTLFKLKWYAILCCFYHIIIHNRLIVLQKQRMCWIFLQKQKPAGAKRQPVDRSKEPARGIYHPRQKAIVESSGRQRSCILADSAWDLLPNPIPRLCLAEEFGGIAAACDHSPPAPANLVASAPLSCPKRYHKALASVKINLAVFFKIAYNLENSRCVNGGEGNAGKAANIQAGFAQDTRARL